MASNVADDLKKIDEKTLEKITALLAANPKKCRKYKEIATHLKDIGCKTPEGKDIERKTIQNKFQHASHDSTLGRILKACGYCTLLFFIY